MTTQPDTEVDLHWHHGVAACCGDARGGLIVQRAQPGVVISSGGMGFDGSYFLGLHFIVVWMLMFKSSWD